MTTRAINFVRLDHVQLCIPPGNEDAARHFYKDVMGLTEIAKPAELASRGGMWFQIADIQLHIGVENEINQSKRHPAFEIENIQAAREWAERNDIKIREEIQLPGQSRFSIIDPFGNRIELLEKTANL